MTENAIVVCATCGIPARVTFDAAGNVAEVYSVCGHVKKPDSKPAGARP